MTFEQDVRDIAERSDEHIRQKLLEYILLRERLIQLTGVAEPNEAFLIDILPIENDIDRRLAGWTAARMRRIARETFPVLTD